LVSVVPPKRSRQEVDELFDSIESAIASVAAA
jgi:hypothetical protein